MKIISLWQPWASLWAGGQKKIETRGKSWFAGHDLPLWVAVHAAKNERELLMGATEPFKSAMASLGYRRVDDLPLGCVVGVVRIVRIYQFGPTDTAPLYPECMFGDYRVGRFGYATDAWRTFGQPIPLRGQQGVWEWARPADAKWVERVRPDAQVEAAQSAVARAGQLSMFGDEPRERIL